MTRHATDYRKLNAGISTRSFPTWAGRDPVVGLLWHSVNSDNLGIGALTQSQIAIIEGIAEELGLSPRFEVLGWLDRREPYVRGPNVHPLPLKVGHFVSYSDGLYAAARRCDFVCDIGGGDSFTDIYGFKRFAFLAWSKIIVLSAQRPLVLSPQTIGPFTRPGTRRVARELMRRCRAVVLRDDLSLPSLDGLHHATRVIAATDVAFRLPYDPPLPRYGSVRVGLNVSGLLFNGGYNRRNMFGLSVDYPALIQSLLRLFTEIVPDCQVHLVCHVITDEHEIEDDYRVARLLARSFPTAVLAPRFRSPSEAKSYIAGMDFFCGSRMHACIAALSSGVPILPLAYSRKFSGVFGALGYMHIANCQNETHDTIVEKVIDAFVNREKLRAAAATANARAAERLSAYEDLLRECLMSAARIDA